MRSILIKNCMICNKSFKFRQRLDKPDRKFCGNACKFTYQANNPPRSRLGFYTECEYCGKNFYKTTRGRQRNGVIAHQTCCSASCANLNKTGKCLNGKKKRHNFSFTCKNCKQTIDGQQNNRVKTAKFCSYSCRAIYYMKHNSKRTIPEIEFEKKLNTFNIKYVQQYQLENKIYDFYIPAKNLLIEIDGIFWHGKDYHDGIISYDDLKFVQQRVINNDNIKQHIAKTNNIELLRIWETDINNFNMELLI